MELLLITLLAYGVVVEILTLTINRQYSKGVYILKEMRKQGFNSMTPEEWNLQTGMSPASLSLLRSYGVIYLALVISLIVFGIYWAVAVLIIIPILKHTFVKHANNERAIEKVENIDGYVTILLYTYLIIKIM